MVQFCSPIMSERPFKQYQYRAVLDTRDLQLNLSPELSSPIGALYHTIPRPPKLNPDGTPVAPVVVKAPVNNEQRDRARQKTNFEENDKIGFWVIFEDHDEQDSSISFRVIVPDDAVPTHLDSDIIHRGVTIKVKMLERHLNNTNIGHLKKFLGAESGEPISPIDKLPLIVRKTPKFDEMKESLYKMTFNIDNKDKVTSENLFTSLTFGHAPTQRAVEILREIFDREAVSFDVYIRDEACAAISGIAEDIFSKFDNEREIGNVFRRFYTQNLQLTNDPHNIDTGTSLKTKADRPKLTTNPQSSFPDVFEMTTRLRVAIKQDLEHKIAMVHAINCSPANVRILSALGVGDLQYFGFISGVSKEVSFTPGDTLELHFPVFNNTPDENWTFTVLAPLSWSLQGEIVGTLQRPKVLLPPDVAPAEKKAYRPYHNTNLPITECLAVTMKEARTVLENATYVKCILSFHSSDKAERAVQALNIIMNGSRPMQNRDRERGDQARQDSESVVGWGEWWLMKDARVCTTRNLIDSKLGLAFMERLADADHAGVTEYLQQAPVGITGKCVAVINGQAGSGKSEIAATFVVAFFLSKPDARILLLAGANSAAGVLLSKVNKALNHARTLGPDYQSALANKIAVRDYSDKAEDFILAPTKSKYFYRDVNSTGEYENDPVNNEISFGIHPAPLRSTFNRDNGFARIVTATSKFICTESNQRHMESYDLVIVDDSGRVNLSDIFIPLAAIDCDTLVMLGDRTQFTPSVPAIMGPVGCTRDLGMSIMELLARNHWPSATLNFQRRGAPGISALYSPLFYKDTVIDAACTSIADAHLKTGPLLGFFKALAPDCGSDLPVRFFDCQGHNELADEVTSSWYNLDEAAVIMNIVEQIILKGIIAGEEIVVMTHYTAQEKVFLYALSSLNKQFPGNGFDLVTTHTTDTFQGHGALLAIGSPVRTNTPGFTSDKGRNCVFLTRAKDFSLTVANVTNLNNTNGRGVPYMRQCLYTAKKKGICVTVSTENTLADLMVHRYVNSRVLGTEENISQVEGQELFPAYSQEEYVAPDENEEGNAGGFTQVGENQQQTGANNSTWDNSGVQQQGSLDTYDWNAARGREDNSTFGAQEASFIPQASTFNPQAATFNPQASTFIPLASTFIPQAFTSTPHDHQQGSNAPHAIVPAVESEGAIMEAGAVVTKHGHLTENKTVAVGKSRGVKNAGAGSGKASVFDDPNPW